MNSVTLCITLTRSTFIIFFARLSWRLALPCRAQVVGVLQVQLRVEERSGKKNSMRQIIPFVRLGCVDGWLAGWLAPTTWQGQPKHLANRCYHTQSCA